MAIFNSYVKLPEGNCFYLPFYFLDGDVSPDSVPRLDPDWTTVMLHTNHPLDEPRQQHIPRDAQRGRAPYFDVWYLWDSMNLMTLFLSLSCPIHGVFKGGSPWFPVVHLRGSRPSGRPFCTSKDSHDHGYAERAMVKTAERAETTQVRKAVRELGDVLYKKPHPQWAEKRLKSPNLTAELRRDPLSASVVHIL